MDDFDARRASLDLITAFVNNNKLSAAELPTLLSDVFKAISGFEMQDEQLAQPDDKLIGTEINAEPALPSETQASEAPGASAAPGKVNSSPPKKTTKAPRAIKPAVSIRESLSDPDFIVSLITGEKFKMLKRHLRHHGLNETEYRARFNLPDDYPIVAPGYSQVRRNVAHKIHGSAGNTPATGEPDASPAAAAMEETSRTVKAKPAPKKKDSEANATGTSAAGTTKRRGVRKSETKIAEAVTKVSALPAQALDGAAATSANPAHQAEPVKVAGPARNAPVETQTKKRRMARQPAAESETSSAAIPTKEAKVEGARPDAARKRRAAKSAKAGGVPATTEGANAKPARKERKKLSAVFG